MPPPMISPTPSNVRAPVTWRGSALWRHNNAAPLAVNTTGQTAASENQIPSARTVSSRLRTSSPTPAARRHVAPPGRSPPCRIRVSRAGPTTASTA